MNLKKNSKHKEKDSRRIIMWKYNNHVEKGVKKKHHKWINIFWF